MLCVIRKRMTALLSIAALLPLALQGAIAPATPAPRNLSDLPVIEAAAPRCGIAFAVVEGWQNAGDPRGGAWPVMTATGAREFFVVAMARLMDARGLTREDEMQMVAVEMDRHAADNGVAVASMMPACLVLLEGSGIQAS